MLRVYILLKNSMMGSVQSELDQRKEEAKISLDLADSAKGCMFGAAIGDSVGSYLEFYKDKIDKIAVEKAMGMPGGGCHGIAPGQITDDCELALCLAHGLVEGKGDLDLFAIVRWLGYWYYKFSPFDVGFTTQLALINADPYNPKPDFVTKCNEEGENKDSESNGSLMRIFPLAIWGYKLSDNDLATAAYINTGFMHSKPVIKQASACYCIAIKSLLTDRGERENAYQRARLWAVENKKREILEWFDIIEKDEEIDATKNIGWAKIGFVYSFLYLRRNYSYDMAIRKMISKGGDTDTNASIVGGLIGACEGYSNLPKDKVDTVLTCRPDRNVKDRMIKRNDKLWPSKYGHSLVDSLLHLAPKVLRVIGSSRL